MQDKSRQCRIGGTNTWLLGAEFGVKDKEAWSELDELRNKIEACRLKLHMAVECAPSLKHETVIAVSKELDLLVLEFEQRSGGSVRGGSRDCGGRRRL